MHDEFLPNNWLKLYSFMVIYDITVSLVCVWQLACHCACSCVKE